MDPLVTRIVFDVRFEGVDVVSQKKNGPIIAWCVQAVAGFFFLVCGPMKKMGKRGPRQSNPVSEDLLRDVFKALEMLVNVLKSCVCVCV